MGTETYRSTQLQRMITEKEIPHADKDAIGSYALRQWGEVAPLTKYIDIARAQSFTSNMDISYRRWRRHFGSKEPTTVIKNPLTLSRVITEYMKVHEGKDIEIDYFITGLPNYQHFARAILINTHGLDTETNILGNLSITADTPVYLKDGELQCSIYYINSLMVNEYDASRVMEDHKVIINNVIETKPFPTGMFTQDPYEIASLFPLGVGLSSGATYDREYDPDRPPTAYTIPDYDTVGGMWSTGKVVYKDAVGSTQWQYTFTPQNYPETVPYNRVVVTATYQIGVEDTRTVTTKTTTYLDPLIDPTVEVSEETDSTQKGNILPESYKISSSSKPEELISSNETTEDFDDRTEVTKVEVFKKETKDNYDLLMNINYNDYTYSGKWVNDSILYDFLKISYNVPHVPATDGQYHQIGYRVKGTNEYGYLTYDTEFNNNTTLKNLLTTKLSFNWSYEDLPLIVDFKDAPERYSEANRKKISSVIRALGFKWQEIIDDLREGAGGDQDKIRDAYMKFGVPVNASQKAQHKYHVLYLEQAIKFERANGAKDSSAFEFFEMGLPDTNGYSHANVFHPYGRYRLPQPKPPEWLMDMPLMSGAIIPVLDSSVYGFTIAAFTHKVYQGKFGDVGDTRKHNEPYTNTIGGWRRHKDMGQVPTSSSRTYQLYRYDLQVSESEYVRVCYVAGGSGLYGDKNRDISKAAVTLDYSLRNKFNFREREIIYSLSVYFYIMTQVTVKTSWWDDWGLFIMIVVVVVVSVITAGSGTGWATNLATSMAGSSAGMAYTAAYAFLNVMAAMAVMAITNMLSGTLMGDVFQVAMLVYAMYNVAGAMNSGAAISSMRGDILAMAGRAGSTYQNFMQKNVASLSSQLARAQEEYETKMQETRDFLAELTGNKINAFKLNDGDSLDLGFIHVGESVDQMIARTICFNTGQTAIDYIGKSIDMALQLPSANDSAKQFMKERGN